MKSKLLATILSLMATTAFASTDTITKNIDTKLDSCNSIAIQYHPNGRNSEAGDADQLYNLSILDARETAKKVADKAGNTSILYKDHDSCQLVVSFKE